MRLFVGIPAPKHESLIRCYSSLRTLGNSVKPVMVQNLHLTLKFIGETSIEPENILGSIERVVGMTPPFQMSPNVAGAFPDWSRPSVLWIGFEDEGKSSAMADRIDLSFREEFGLPREKRAFKPHLTLARIKDEVDHEDLRTISLETLEVLKAEKYSIPVDRIVLYKSTLKQTGPIYEEIGSIRILG
jgi:RNA 2',3'-cyclic 3'-phosphodiesterase